MRSPLVPALLVALAPLAASAHARLEYPTPRSQKTGIKTNPPCGLDPRTAPTVFAPGETITVTWVETITHPGYYRIAFSPANDLDFDQYVLADNIPNPSGLQNGSKAVTLPSTPCEGCSLQLIQVMTGSNPPSNYYSCADIAIRAAAVDAGSGTEDAGSDVDAGSSTADSGLGVLDAGLSADAGSPPEQYPDGADAGFDNSTVSGGCSTAGLGAWAIAALASIALGLRSRRRA